MSPLVLLAEAGAGETLLTVLLYVVLGLLVAAGVGAAVATLRVVLPGLSAAADRAL
jgi:predicted histidine transporter YuiF (NhaC family)